MATINILACANGVGISRDISIIKDVLEKDGHTVFCNHTFRYAPSQIMDLNIWLERFNPITMGSANKELFIPNQEWFEPKWMEFMSGFNAVLAKTRFAEKVFSQIGKTYFISFTSEDRYLPHIKKDYNHWIHVAGKSIQKQTELVIKTWQDNPGFPQLTIVQDKKFWRPRILAKNINFLIDRVPEDVLLALQNACPIHICPSETEGFGHYIMEGMSTGGVVLTTDGPPMNELVSSDTGVLVPPVRSEPVNLSTRFILSQDALTQAVIKLTISDQGKLFEKGQKARAFFLENDKIFRQLLVKAVNETLA